ncbi:FmdB family zinc ribbon protein [Andreprevotia chitinilytica]|uniref:FmdB family zinc ribbon protein n=1 Tax=Andreprevotia chitinilytica TaxID=396808 RepID=UPI000556C589|nr:FmdB family zinc ribbon protein [Andreprevotia chitinilytica]
MPIYAYRCSSCGHENDHMQKLADAPLTECPSCHADTYQKKITAAGFQLKGTGWYATDFKGGTSGSSAASSSESAPACPGGSCACH